MLNFHRIPGELTEYFKREIGDASIELVWLPDEDRLSPWFRFNDFDKGKGCFGICKWVHQALSVEVQGVVHNRSERIPYITPLNGNHGNPFHPGRWVVDMFVESDTCRRGKTRLKELDDWREGKIIHEVTDRDRLASEYAHDPLMYNAMKRYADDVGTETPSREEMVAMEKYAVERSAALEDKDQKDRKIARFYENRDTSEIL